MAKTKNRMTYIDLVNNFWQKDIEHRFSDKDIALYFYLLKTCNSIGWKNPFGLSNLMTVAQFGWGKQALDTAKQRLQRADLIDFKCAFGRGRVYQYIIKGIDSDTFSDTFSLPFSPTFSNPKAETSLDIDIDKEKNKKKNSSKKENVRFVIPTVELIDEYCIKRANGIDAEQFFDYYQSKDWMIGHSPMRDWRAAVRTWERNEQKKAKKHGQTYTKLTEINTQAAGRKAEIVRRAADAIAECDQ